MAAQRRNRSRRLELKGSLWIAAGGESLGGHGRIALLSAVGEAGSITQAAKALGMSYTTLVWELRRVGLSIKDVIGRR